MLLHGLMRHHFLDMDINDFDQVLIELTKKIKSQPSEKHRIIMRAIKESECPYIKRKLKEAFPYGK